MLFSYRPGMGLLSILFISLCIWEQYYTLSIHKDPLYEELRRLVGFQDNELEEKIKVPIEIKNWSPKVTLGQVTAVSVNSKGNPVVFHRGDRVWDENSFNESHVYQQVKAGPIKDETIVELDANTGEPLLSWGAGIFYMPHGLTVDKEDNVWVTDVAMHQVLKYPPGGSEVPMLTLGRQFEGGWGHRRQRDVLLCMPTSVAVSSTGFIFVADGYCNNQILQFNLYGRLLRTIPQPPHFLSLQIPHSLALVEDLDLICVADRENMRVVCEKAGLYGPRLDSPPLTIHAPDLGRVFAVVAHENLLYAVNGPTSPMIPISGFTIDPRSETVLDHWGPVEGFQNPHSVAISPDGKQMYVTEIGPNKIWKFQLIREK